jgi:hypothetical protein
MKLIGEYLVLALVILCLGAAPTTQEVTDVARAKMLKTVMEKLRPLHTPMGKPRPGDWLAKYPEPGQTFQEYLDGTPTLPQGPRTVIYIQPIGDFTKEQRKIVELTATFMGLYFNLAVKMQPDLPLDLIPAKARRLHPQWGDKQILTTYVLDSATCASRITARKPIAGQSRYAPSAWPRSAGPPGPTRWRDSQSWRYSAARTGSSPSWTSTNVPSAPSAVRFRPRRETPATLCRR